MTPVRLLQDVLVAARDGLTTRPKRVFIAPGWDAAWDGGDQLWVKLTSSVPRYQRGDARCILGTTLSIEVGVLRCVAVIDDDGKPPTANRMTEDAAVLLRDMDELAAALAAHEPEGAHAARLTSWRPLGPQGGLAGGVWTYAVEV